MEESIKPELDKRIRKFTGGLKKDLEGEISRNPGSFKSFVIGKLRAVLPRRKPGRKGTPEFRKASEIYQRDYLAKSLEGGWHRIAKEVYPDYVTLSPEIQRLRRISIRSAVHSLRYDQRSRAKRAR
jgi:hypothetical protein